MTMGVLSAFQLRNLMKPADEQPEDDAAPQTPPA